MFTLISERDHENEANALLISGSVASNVNYVPSECVKCTQWY